MPIQRVTSFKVLSEADIPPFLDQYSALRAKNEKDGKPYILDIQAYQTHPDDRNHGFNLVALTRFKNLEDMKYYDEQCEAHKQLKAFAKGKVAGPPLTMFGEV